jgi:hypothetical protein
MRRMLVHGAGSRSFVLPLPYTEMWFTRGDAGRHHLARLLQARATRTIYRRCLLRVTPPCVWIPVSTPVEFSLCVSVSPHKDGVTSSYSQTFLCTTTGYSAYS